MSLLYADRKSVFHCALGRLKGCIKSANRPIIERRLHSLYKAMETTKDFRIMRTTKQGSMTGLISMLHVTLTLLEVSSSRI